MTATQLNELRDKARAAGANGQGAWPDELEDIGGPKAGRDFESWLVESPEVKSRLQATDHCSRFLDRLPFAPKSHRENGTRLGTSLLMQLEIPMSGTKLVVNLWHYHCPECGFGDGEIGHHASVDLIWCEVCLEEKRHVRLKRWSVEEESGPLPGS